MEKTCTCSYFLNKGKLCKHYWSVVHWMSDPKNHSFNPSFRQLLHVSFKVAAQKGTRYLDALKKHEEIVARNVTDNLFERHMKPLLIGN